MNKTIIININSIVFHIEEDAYETLRSYMIDIKKHFGNTAESKEILEDIENRIAEMFNERIQTGRKEVLNLSDVQEVIAQMGQVSDFEISEEHNNSQYQQAQQEHASDLFGKKLMRDPDDKLLGGVCSGLAHYFNMEPRWARVLFMLFVLIGGSGFLVYIILWIVMPQAETRADKMAMRGEEPNLQNFKKSFEEEVKSFSSSFSGAGEQLGRSAQSAGSFATVFLKLIAKMLAWFILIMTALSLLGLFIFYAFNLMNLFGLENPMIFPPLENLSTDDAIIAITFGFLATGIPLFAFALLLIRLLFKTEKLNSYLSLSLFATWLVAVVGIIYFSVSTAQDFREKSTISIQRSINPKDVYSFNEKDVRILDATEQDSLKSRFNMPLDGTDLRKQLISNIGISFESVDSLSKPYIQYNYTAKGRTYDLASERAKNIVYEAVQDNDGILFPSHFLLRERALDRDQYVGVVIYLPVGSRVLLNQELERKLRGLSFYECRINYQDADYQQVTEWKMTKTGLVCSQAAKQEKTEDVIEEVIVVETKQDSLATAAKVNGATVVADKEIKASSKQQ